MISTILGHNRSSRHFLPLLVVFFLTFIVISSRYSSSSSINGATNNNNDDAAISIKAVVKAASEALTRRVKSLEYETIKRDLGISLDSEITLESYDEDLRATWRDYFLPRSLASENASSSRSPPPHQSVLDIALSKLSLLPPDRETTPIRPLPKHIYTTDLLPPDQLPEQFQTWIKHNEDWTTMFVSDEEIDTWLETALGSGSLRERTEGREKLEVGVVREMKRLKGDWGVVRADLFRYLVLLLNGGIYTDTDTASVLPISEWARNPVKALSSVPMLDVLPQLVEMAQPQTLHHLEPFQAHEVPTEQDEEDSPSLLVALEIDAPDSETDWKDEGFVRGIQVVQWTIMAKKGHPVLLDVIGRALRQAEEVAEGGKRDVNILDWSGPGAFTDAVFRYLLVRYGFHPSQASGLKQPLRIGDVVIMPVHSFRADASEGPFQGEHRVVWHGFFGRWKGKE
nr:uncharacterized protein CI109_000188 [Kwoniella shandongensis]KAA5531347.1 hypothetical protein CI109_000188 [Kwoniella shandongensis]